jgi:hypothetical protein
MALALLMSTGGVGIEEIAKNARARARCVRLDDMNIADFIPDGTQNP